MSAYSPECFVTLQVCTCGSTFISFTLLWALGNLTTATAASKVLWLLFTFGGWEALAGMESGGRESVGGLVPQFPPDKVASWPVAEWPQALSSWLLQAELAWALSPCPFLSSSGWKRVSEILPLLYRLFLVSWTLPLWLLSIIKLALIASFGLHQCPARTLNESAIQFSSHRLLNCRRYMDGSHTDPTLTMSQGY